MRDCESKGADMRGPNLRVLEMKSQMNRTAG